MNCYEKVGAWSLPAIIHEKQQPNVSFVVDGKVVACGGIHPLCPGVGDVWLFLAKPTGPEIVKEVKNQMYEWIRDYRFHRVQTLVDYCWKEGRRFTEWVGLEYEGRLRKMTERETDMALYAWVR